MRPTELGSGAATGLNVKSPVSSEDVQGVEQRKDRATDVSVVRSMTWKLVESGTALALQI
jgi:hypothetical protein